MKFRIFFLCLALLPISTTFASVNCKIEILIQKFNTETGVSEFISGKTSDFLVVQAEHEDAYSIDILAADKHIINIAKVDTGTLLDSSDGNIYQAHAKINLYGSERYLGLMADIHSRISISHQYFDFIDERNKLIEMTNLFLKCSTN
jgi:hypothetical protein